MAGAPVACDDGISCTTDSCDTATGCVHIPNDLQCSDGNPCTSDSCSVTEGCLFLPDEGKACNDGNICTEDDQCTLTPQGSTVCEGESIPDCSETFPLCELVGNAGNEVECPVNVVRESSTSPGVAAMQFDLEYNPAELVLVNATGSLCPTPDPNLCFDVDLMPSGNLSSGHTVSSQPSDPALCAGDVTYILSNIADPFALVSEAFLDAGGDTVGDSLIFTLRFTLASNATAGSPAVVSVSNIVGASAEAEAILMSVENNQIQSGELKP